MGLDMSLYACRSMVFENDSIFDEIKKFITIPFPNATLNNIQVEVMSWRKANAIHNWFINNCTNGVEWCYPTQVFIGQLVKLRDICKEVLDHSELVPAKIIDSYTYQLSPSGVLVEKANMVDGYVILDPTFARNIYLLLMGSSLVLQIMTNITMKILYTLMKVLMLFFL